MHCQYQVQAKLKQKSDLHSSVAVLLVSWRTSYGGSFGSGSEQAMSNLRLDCARWCQTAVQLAIGLKSLLSAMHPLAKIWCTMQNVTIATVILPHCIYSKHCTAQDVHLEERMA